MYFLSTNILGPKHVINKLSPKFNLTIKSVFVFGCLFYFVLCIFLYVLVSDNTWDEYKYYLYLIIVLDLSYFLYSYKKQNYLKGILIENNSLAAQPTKQIKIQSPQSQGISQSQTETNTSTSHIIATPHPRKSKKHILDITTTSSIFDLGNSTTDDYKITHEVLSDQSDEISVFSSKSSSSGGALSSAGESSEAVI